MTSDSTNLRAVQAARQRLDALAQDHEELTNKGAPSASVDAWERTLEESMGKTVVERQREYRERQEQAGKAQVALWLPEETVQTLDALKDSHGGTREGVIVAAVQNLKKRSADYQRATVYRKPVGGDPVKVQEFPTFDAAIAYMRSHAGDSSDVEYMWAE